MLDSQFVALAVARLFVNTCATHGARRIVCAVDGEPFFDSATVPEAGHTEACARAMVKETDECVVSIYGDGPRRLAWALFIGENGFDALSDYGCNEWADRVLGEVFGAAVDKLAER
jgi:hypothetical protein